MLARRANQALQMLAAQEIAFSKVGEDLLDIPEEGGIRSQPAVPPVCMKVRGFRTLVRWTAPGPSSIMTRIPLATLSGAKRQDFLRPGGPTSGASATMNRLY